jgi:hypothetical protein
MLERTDEFNAQVLAFLTGETSYLDSAVSPPEEIAGRDEDAAAAKTFEEPSPLAPTEPGDPESSLADPGSSPRVTPKQGGLYPSGDREPEDAEDRSNASSPTVDRHPDQPTKGDDTEVHPQERTGNEGGTGVPEAPADLFEWPDSLKKSQPWDRPRETTDRQEEHGEETDPEGPEEKPHS